MTKKALLFICIVLVSFSGLARKKRIPGWATGYVVKALVEKVATDQPIVIEYYQESLERQSEGVVRSVKQVIKVRNLDGILQHSNFVILLNGKDKLLDLKAYHINNTQRILESLTKRDITTKALNLNFIDDSKQAIGSFSNVKKGDVLILSYSVLNKDLLYDYFVSFPADGYVKHAEIVVGSGARTKLFNNQSGKVKNQGNKWVLEDYEPPKEEPLMPPLENLIPKLGVSFSEQSTSWESLARYYYSLAFPSMNLPATIKVNYQQEETSSPVTDILYYVAKTVNYVDIEIGAGRIVPKKSTFVLEKKYGDCKDKSFLAINLLKNAGYNAYPLLVKGSSHGKVYPDFPAMQFNHVIVAVELKDTDKGLKNIEIDGKPFLLFDVTDRITKAPYFPSSLQGTYGLLVRKEGGRLIQLPVFNPDDNYIKVVSTCYLSSDNSLDLNVDDFRKGIPAFNRMWAIDGLNNEKIFKHYFNFYTDEIDNSQLRDCKVEADFDTVKSRFSLSVDDYAIKTAKGYLLLPFPYFANMKNSFRKRTRKSDIVYSSLLKTERENRWEISPSYSIVKLPDNVEIDSPYFYFKKEVVKDGKYFIFKTVFIRKKRIIPASEYKTFRKVYKKYVKALKQPIVLAKN